MKIIPSLALLSIALLFLAGCSKPAEVPKQDDSKMDSRVGALEETVDLIIKDPELARIHNEFPEAQSTDSGLHYIITKEGSGDTTPNKGDSVTAHYKGTLLNGARFDSSYDRGDPFNFQVGLGNVIKGWDEAFLAMKKGEKRKLIIPSKLGYGSRGAGGSIPPNATLIFEVELLDF